MSNIWEDSRFSNLIRDARFKNLPKYKKQTKIDKRFKPMFDGDKFKSKKGVDKYGRQLRDSTGDDLRKFYDLDSEENDDSEAEIEKEAILEEKAIKAISDDENYNNQGDLLSNDGVILPSKIKDKLLADVDFARGEGKILSDSSSEEESSEEEDNQLEHEFWGELDKEVEETEESSKRLAFCNMDWEQIKASDIMVLCHSFLPVGGAIINVKIFVSNFGKECLKEEETKGPLDLVNLKKEKKNYLKIHISDNDDSEHEGDAYDMEKLRQYQINKLKYYYAVVECDSKKTAEKLYQECDGLEYESTSTKLDLRFIPEEMIFDEQDIKEECSDLPSDMSNYKPLLQPVTALQQAKVKVTWDETTIERKQVFDKLSSGKFDEISSMDLKKFINCSEDEISNDENNEKEIEPCVNNDIESKINNDNISKYKFLLETIKEKEKRKSETKYEMEYTWGIDTAAIKKNELKDDDGGYSSDDIPSNIDMNDPYFAEEFNNSKMKKKKNKKEKDKQNMQHDEDKSKINELKLLLNDHDDNNDHKTTQKSKKKLKRKRKEDANLVKKEIKIDPEENFQVNVKDARFENIYTNTSYSIDPNNPRFKKTAGMENIIHEKIKRRTYTKKEH